MSFGKVISILFTFILGLPLLGMFIFNVTAASYVMQMMGMVNDAQRQADEDAASDFAGVPVVPENARGLRALRNFEQFDPSRVVTLNIQMKLEDIRHGDDTRVGAEEADGYVSARLPALASAECAMIEKAFADKCATTQVSADPYGKFYNVRMTLTFTQREPFGEVRKADSLNYLELPVNLNQTKEKLLMTSSWVSQRKEYYAAVARSCAQIRSKNRNCAISNIRIVSTPDRKSSAVRVLADAWFAVLQ